MTLDEVFAERGVADNALVELMQKNDSQSSDGLPTADGGRHFIKFDYMEVVGQDKPFHVVEIYPVDEIQEVRISPLGENLLTLSYQVQGKSHSASIVAVDNWGDLFKIISW